MDLDARREVARRILARLVAHDDDPGDTLGGDLLRDVGGGERPVEGLASGHCDRVVVEDLVGDVDAGRDRGADREDPAVIVRAVAQVREDVLLGRERRLADPRHALAAHVRVGARAAVHPDRHHVAADAGRRATALGHLGRRVVRAAGAEPRLPLERDPRLLERGLLGIDPVDARLQFLRLPRMQPQPLDPLRDHARDHRRRQLGERRQEPIAVRADPLALLVELADDARADVVAPVVELLLQLVLDDLALLLDDEDLLEAFRELADALRLERPGHRDLVDADADLGRVRFADAEVVERLADVEVALAAGDDAEARLRRVDDDPVQPVDAAVVERGVDLVVLHPRLGREERIGPPDRHAVRRQGEVGRHDDRRALRVDVDGRGALDRVGDALEADPAARVAAHRPAVEAEVEDLLHRRGIEHGKHRRREHVVGLVRQRRRLRAVVVARQHEHAAMLRRAGVVRVLEHVAAAVDARPLAVPHPEHAVVLGAGVEVHLLRAPQRGRREVLVQARLEPDVRAVEEGLRLPQRQIERAQGRPAVARDEAGGVEAGERVALPLQYQEADERLRAGEEDAAGLEGVLVVERDVAQDWGGVGN